MKSLAEKYPEIAKQWHPSKNGNLTPNHVTAYSGKKVWWLCPTCDGEWKAIVAFRCPGGRCPYCAEYAIIPGDKKLADVNPKLASEWHPWLNNKLTPKRATEHSTKKVWWKCPACGNEWDDRICNRTAGAGCSRCKPQYAEAE